MAQTQGAPKLTDAENETLKTYGELRSCTQAGLQSAAEQAVLVVKQIVDARAKAGGKATADAAKAAGMTPAQADLLSQALVAADTQAL